MHIVYQNEESHGITQTFYNFDWIDSYFILFAVQQVVKVSRFGLSIGLWQQLQALRLLCSVPSYPNAKFV